METSADLHHILETYLLSIKSLTNLFFISSFLGKKQEARSKQQKARCKK